VGYFEGKMKYFKRMSKEMKNLFKKDGLLLKEADNDILQKDDQGDKRAYKGG